MQTIPTIPTARFGIGRKTPSDDTYHVFDNEAGLYVAGTAEETYADAAALAAEMNTEHEAGRDPMELDPPPYEIDRWAWICLHAAAHYATKLAAAYEAETPDPYDLVFNTIGLCGELRDLGKRLAGNNVHAFLTIGLAVPTVHFSCPGTNEETVDVPVAKLQAGIGRMPGYQNYLNSK